MSGMQNVSFGSLTAKSVQSINIDEADLNKDGIISEEELAVALSKNEFDVVELSTTDKDADQKVTQEQYDLWQQEAEMLEYLETMKTQAVKDLVGQSVEDIKSFVEKLTEYEKTFKEGYMSTHKNVSGMSAAFMQDLSNKYVEFKKDVLSNTKSAVTTRVVKNVIDSFIEEDRRSGNQFLKLVDKKASSLSDNTKRLLTNELSREAERFVSKYEGTNLEEDLAAHLRKYLSQSDKEKLADAVGLWEKGKQEIEELSDEVKFLKIKAKAKNLLLTALENDISIKVGDIIVRSEAAIPAALGQFKDTDSLIWAFDKAINELSSKTRAQEIREKDEERKQAAVEEAYEAMLKQKEQDDYGNIFK